MNKQSFLDELRRGLSGLPEEDIQERLSFYSEMIDDGMEEGLSEEEAVSRIGSVEEIVSQTISDIPLTKLVKEKVKPNRSLKAWEIVLIILGFPVWFPLLIAAVSVIFSLYIVLWSLIIALWAVVVVMIAATLVSLVGAVVFAVKGFWLNALAAFGAAVFLAGLSVFLCIGGIAASKGILTLTKKIALGIKSLFIKKEADHNA